MRLAGICNGNAESTVLAHYRLHSGLAIKPPDWQGAYACSACHDEIDRRTRLLSKEEARLAHAEGVLRTQKRLIEKGLLAWK